jgi:ubiquitin C-terminal hydrolase
VELGCKPCISHGQRIDSLEAVLSEVRKQLEDLKKVMSNKVKSQCEAKNDVKSPNTAPNISSQSSSRSIGKTKRPQKPSQPEAIKKQFSTVSKSDSTKPKLKVSSDSFDANHKYSERVDKDRAVVAGIQRMKLSSTCYINAAVQTLFNFQEFSNFVKSNQFDRNRHSLLLQLQKLYHHCRLNKEQKSSIQCVSNKELIDCLYSKKLNISLKRQNDSVEFFESLIEEIVKEIESVSSTRWRNTIDIKGLLSADILESTTCQICKNGNIVDYSNITVNLKDAQHGQVNTTVTDKLQELLQARNIPSWCTKCRRDTKSTSTFDYGFSEYICLRVARNIWNSKSNKMERVKQQVRPEKSLRIKLEHQDIEAEYNLTGGVVHKGGANSGHYFNIANVSGDWYEINDEKVTEMPEYEVIQQLENDGVLIIYQKVQDSYGQIKPARDRGTKADIGQEPKYSQIRSGDHKIEESQSSTSSRRSHFFRASNTRKPLRPERTRWRKIYIRKSYYDPDKNCFYIPKV